ncbi:LOW QUALITY PROTEIN: glucoside xylosyltransferase 2-like [Microcaecilia unicolor]|uniref:UDP-D-xylose:beta-D-glucoside alpha-1,3-D-xylosyltransferase n=1 Tax=Microcaecilia unicolor TaxID=1415580 RepID=A0A6P7Y950_9AMPH|nr:LOW QUALITY PROTEIN: glucoside xylosyltransferase 2-like [Microcaecilia unicolor]
MKLYWKLLLLLLGCALSLLLYLRSPLQPKLVKRTDRGTATATAASPAKVRGGISSPITGRGSSFLEAPVPKKEPRPKDKKSKRKDAQKRRRHGDPKYVKMTPLDNWMHLAVVACGERLEETLTMLKSALLFSKKSLRFHIFADDSLKPEIQKKLQEWQNSHRIEFDYTIYPITFSVGNAQEWRKLFKPCAAQRLFLPVILQDVDSLLYVDTDVLFLRSMDDIWAFLKEFNATQLAAMAPEHEIPKIGWYSRFARHPYYGLTGLNSGVMLMNLTRIRKTQFKNSMIPTGLTWEEMMYPLYQKYKNYITWGDQDLLNIIFYFNPESVYVLPCQWNYRPDHCMYGTNCKGAEEEGISILHGNRGVYHDEKQPTFKAVYKAIDDFTFEDNLFQSLYYPLQAKFLETVHTLCGRIPQVFLKQIEKTIKEVYQQRVFVHMAPPN